MPVARPLSPHLQIYRPELTSVLSILHRATGVFLCLGLALLIYWVVAIASGPECYASFARIAGSWFGALVLLGFAFSLLFHLANGVRHLVWDLGRGLDLATSAASGWTVVAVAALGTGLVAIRLFGGA